MPTKQSTTKKWYMMPKRSNKRLERLFISRLGYRIQWPNYSWESTKKKRTIWTNKPRRRRSKAAMDQRQSLKQGRNLRIPLPISAFLSFVSCICTLGVVLNTHDTPGIASGALEDEHIGLHMKGVSRGIWMNTWQQEHMAIIAVWIWDGVTQVDDWKWQASINARWWQDLYGLLFMQISWCLRVCVCV